MSYADVLKSVQDRQKQFPMSFEFEVEGKTALFSDIFTRSSGECYSYPVITPEAAKGIAKAIYWKPTFIIKIDAIRVMNPIQRENVGQRLPEYDSYKACLANFNFLRNVKYQILAHIEWNENRPELKNDRDALKHMAIMQRAILKGGRRPAYLGKGMCIAEINPCKFGEGEGAFDNTGDVEFSTMFWGFTYPDEGYDEETRNHLYRYMFKPTMQNGIIKVPIAQECTGTKIHTQMMKIFGIQSVEETAKEMGVI